MANGLTGTQRTARQAARLAWLRDRPALLAQLPGANQDVTPVQSDALLEALRAMKLVRLYGASAGMQTVRWSIRLCVSELRGETLPTQDRLFKR